jgi:3-hydroxy acid dehydrogenase/malonic semialdehyde reductase
MCTFSSAAALRLEGKTILITGASSGIGISTAFEFARTCPQNLCMILAALRTSRLKLIAEEIVKEVGQGVKILVVELDVSKADQIRNFVAALAEEWREIDVLVNNA